MRSEDPGREFADMAGKALSIEWLVENAPMVFSKYLPSWSYFWVHFSSCNNYHSLLLHMDSGFLIRSSPFFSFGFLFVILCSLPLLFLHVFSYWVFLCLACLLYILETASIPLFPLFVYCYSTLNVIFNQELGEIRSKYNENTRCVLRNTLIPMTSKSNKGTVAVGQALLLGYAVQ